MSVVSKMLHGQSFYRWINAFMPDCRMQSYFLHNCMSVYM